MPRKSPVQKSFTCSNGITYFGKSVKGAKRLDARIKAYNSYIQTSKTNGRDYKMPGSIKK